jgi:serine/threonine protein kinase
MMSMSSRATLAPNTVIAERYRIEELVGSGGYANVYRATDLTHGGARAIKEVVDTDLDSRQQLALEAELLINAKHHNLLQGYQLVEDRGRLYLVMEYVCGKDLEALLHDSLVQRHLALDEVCVLRWLLAVCDALIAMHSLPTPVIHRDIKPANIKIASDGRPVLIDFGLATLQRTGHPMHTTQRVSPGFAPPEQYLAQGNTDARTDVYGMGATLYACLTGREPPEAPVRLLAQTGATGQGAELQGAELTPVRCYNPQVSETTNQLIVKALALSPLNRQQTAQHLRDEMLRSLRALTPATDAFGHQACPSRPIGNVGTLPHVFISHSHADVAFTERLVQALRNRGVDGWVDIVTLDPDRGDSLEGMIAEAFSPRDVLVLILSPHAIESPWVRREVQTAMNLQRQGRMRDVIPIMVTQCELEVTPPTWATFRWLDATTDFSGALAQLMLALSGHGIRRRLTAPGRGTAFRDRSRHRA